LAFLKKVDFKKQTWPDYFWGSSDRSDPLATGLQEGMNSTRGRSAAGKRLWVGKLLTPCVLSANSINWHRSKGGDALWLGR